MITSAVTPMACAPSDRSRAFSGVSVQPSQLRRVPTIVLPALTRANRDKRGRYDLRLARLMTTSSAIAESPTTKQITNMCES